MRGFDSLGFAEEGFDSEHSAEDRGFSYLAFSSAGFDAEPDPGLAFSGAAFSTEAFAATEVAPGLAFSGAAFSTEAFAATELTDAVVGVAGTLPPLGGSVGVSLGIVATAAGLLPLLGGSVEVAYFTDTSRPLVAENFVRFQDAQPFSAGVVSPFDDALQLQTAIGVDFQDAEGAQRAISIGFDDAKRSSTRIDARFQDGLGQVAGADARFQDAARASRYRTVSFQEALRHHDAIKVTRFQNGINTTAVGGDRVRWQDGLGHQVSTTETDGYGRPIEVGRSTRYQQAIRPPPGRRVRPQPPEPEPCYTPSPDLVFSAQWTADANLLFYCENHPPPEPGATVVVPVRRIYTVINSATLRRVDGDVLIPTLAMSLTIDVDSWTWGFTARTPGSALPHLQRIAGAPPVEVEATINGVAYRALIEGLARDRVFGKSDLNVTGRGKAAVLDAPYSAVMTFGNPSADRTVQQLANDVLTLNGVSLGWDIDAGWEPEDWLVPAGVFSHQGSYITALNAIAGAAGAYVQPHRTAKAMSVLLRYPAKPWEWDDVTPDYELPSDVVKTEGVVWVDKPYFNRVFVQGMKSGVRGQVTRLGTAGDIEAPMVTDQLITDAIGARQRGLPVLADVGRQATYTLRLPVLAETGIIPPGKFVRYVDEGVTRIGLVRSTSAAVERNEKKLTIWQTIGVETHVDV